MKKIVVLVAALSLLAGSAMASSVVDSAHNLSLTGTKVTSNYSEICVFCHTPHAANTSVTLAPLWNRTVSNLTGSLTYTSATLGATAEAVVDTDLIATDAGLCLSCHDGVGLTKDLVNPSNLAGNVQPTLGGAMSLTANLTKDFRNDHPIAFNYSAAVVEDGGGLRATPTGTGVTFFAGEMWCSSCHEVHDDAYTPFLVQTNAASGLCLACHIK